MSKLLTRLIFVIVNGPKHFLNWVLMKIFDFEPWHVSTLASRPYCIDLVDYVNKSIGINGTVVELGCGLGENLAHIKCLHRHGIDKSQEVLEAAKLKYYFTNIQFTEGSFDAVRGEKIDYLIAVNFLHDFDSSLVQEWFEIIIKNNNVLNIIVDELDDEQYYRLHDFNFIIPTAYQEKYVLSNNYNYGRSVRIFTRSPHD